MLGATEVITVYHRAYDAATRRDTWSRQTLANASWYGGKAVNTADKGLNGANQQGAAYKVRIFTAEQINISVGDTLVRGIANTDTPAQAARQAESCTVTRVRDNRRGIDALCHWLLEGS